jgi:hypothetical protein
MWPTNLFYSPHKAFKLGPPGLIDREEMLDDGIAIFLCLKDKVRLMVDLEFDL